MKVSPASTQFTSTFHSVVKHKIQAVLWDVLTWLEQEEEIHSVRDLLSYIRLFTDFGDNNQGRIFCKLIKKHKTLHMILPDIAARLVSRGASTNTAWLEDLGLHIQELHRHKPHPGVSHEREVD